MTAKKTWTIHPREIQEELFPSGFPSSPCPELTVLSFGAGQDSTALLYLLGNDQELRKVFAPKDLIVIFSDTGAEHEETYSEALPVAMSFCADMRIPFYWLRPGSEYHSKSWPSLIDHYRRTGTCGSRGFPRSCTDQLKIRPFYRFLEEYLGTTYQVEIGRKKGFYEYARHYGKLRVLIGLTAEESGRCQEKSRPLWMRRCIDIRYPLQEMRATRSDAQTIITGYGYRVPCPSSCRCCPFLTLRDLLWKYRTRPEEYEELLCLENTKLSRFEHLGEKNYGVYGAMRLPQALTKAEHLFGHLSNSELTEARQRDGHGVRSKY